jgi:hypothetical protein
MFERQAAGRPLCLLASSKLEKPRVVDVNRQKARKMDRRDVSENRIPHYIQFHMERSRLHKQFNPQHELVAGHINQDFSIDLAFAFGASKD